MVLGTLPQAANGALPESSQVSLSCSTLDVHKWFPGVASSTGPPGLPFGSACGSSFAKRGLARTYMTAFLRQPPINHLTNGYQPLGGYSKCFHHPPRLNGDPSSGAVEAPREATS